METEYHKLLSAWAKSTKMAANISWTHARSNQRLPLNWGCSNLWMQD